MPLTLAQAADVISKGIAAAERLQVRISCAVVDEFAELVQVDRMDGASPMSVDIAEAKAVTALNFQRPTSNLSSLDSHLMESIKEVAKFRLFPEAGGVPIVVDNVVVGAVGVSGATGAQDEAVAKAALT